jgi:O-acetyl-ADP-ribose deacetylase (regulator of RNase III)
LIYSVYISAQAGDRTIAFPSISTGTYRYPVDQAAVVAIQTMAEYCRANPEIFAEIRFVLFDEKAMQAFEAALADN